MSACIEYFELLEQTILARKKAFGSTNACADGSKCQTDLELNTILGSAYANHHYCEYFSENYEKSILLAKKALQLTGPNERIQKNINLMTIYRQNLSENEHQNLSNAMKSSIEEKPQTILCRSGAFPGSSNKAGSELISRTKGFKIWEKCKYSNNWNPSLMIQPVKTEVLLEEPYMEFWHQFLTDEEIERLKELGLPELEKLVTP